MTTSTAVRPELVSFIHDLNIDEQIDLVALTWLGRGDGDIENWDELRAEAARAHNKRTAAYLLGCRCWPIIWKKRFQNSAIRRKRSRQICSDRQAFVGKPTPYRTNIDLPASVRNRLPPRAQDIYRAAFNHAFAAHAGDVRQEEIAHRTAWAAVKRCYVRDGDHWVPIE